MQERIYDIFDDIVPDFTSTVLNLRTRFNYDPKSRKDIIKAVENFSRLSSIDYVSMLFRKYKDKTHYSKL